MALRPPALGDLKNSDLYNAISRGFLQHDRLLTLRTPLGDNTLIPIRAKGWSKIGRDYRWIIDVISTRDDIELLALMHVQVSLMIQQSATPLADRQYRPIHGYVHQVRRLGANGSVRYYSI